MMSQSKSSRYPDFRPDCNRREVTCVKTRFERVSAPVHWDQCASHVWSQGLTYTEKKDVTCKGDKVSHQRDGKKTGRRRRVRNPRQTCKTPLRPSPKWPGKEQLNLRRKRIGRNMTHPQELPLSMVPTGFVLVVIGWHIYTGQVPLKNHPGTLSRVDSQL